MSGKPITQQRRDFDTGIAAKVGVDKRTVLLAKQKIKPMHT
jgi:hypothetical protein